MENISQNKRVVKNTLFLYFRSILLLVISLYTSRVTLQVLGVQDYGIYQIVGGIVSMFSMLSSTLASASQRFITYALGENNKEKLRNVFATCVTIHVALGIIVVLLLEIVGLWFLHNKANIPIERIQIAGVVMHFSIATLFLNILTVPFNATIIAHEKMSAFAYIGILDAVLRLAVVFFLTILSWDKLFLYAALNLAVALTIRFIYSVYSNKNFDETKIKGWYFDKNLFRQMFYFAGWNLFGNGSLVLRNQGVDIVLNIFFGVVVNAAKGISNQVQHAVGVFVGNFTTALKPQLTKAIAQKNYERVYVLINNGSRYSFMLMLVVSMPIIISAPHLLKLWLGFVPDYSVIFIQWTMGYLLLDILSRLLIQSILSQGNIKKYQIIVGGTKLFAIPFVYVYLLIDKNPLVGVWVNLFLEFLCLAERLYFTRKLLGFNSFYYLKDVILRCFFMFITTLFFSEIVIIIVSDNFVFSVVSSFLISSIVVWFLGMKKEEHLLLVSFAKKKISCK